MMLRRKLDYAFPNQRAEVFISDIGRENWKYAGIWYLAGSNTCVYSNAGNRNELGATEHVVQTSNRRFRDDEFLVPVVLTKGRSSIRVRVKFTPVETPLFPGYPITEIGLERNAVLGIQFRRAEISNQIAKKAVSTRRDVAVPLDSWWKDAERRTPPPARNRSVQLPPQAVSEKQ